MTNYYLGLLSVVFALAAGMALIYFGVLATGIVRVLLIVIGVLLIAYGVYSLVHLNKSADKSVPQSFQQAPQAPVSQGPLLPKSAASQSSPS